MRSKFDVIVIGGGHAGCEAAAAAARLGANVLLVTHSFNSIGAMSCNPSIGGVGKGIAVREVDAMDGLMAQVIDQTSTYSRVLNRSKGPAVRGPRAQADPKKYAQTMLEIMAGYSSFLTLQEMAVAELLLTGGQNGKKSVSGVVTECGHTFYAPRVVVAAGTFLNGMMHIGLESFSAGRRNASASKFLAEAIKQAGLRYGRLKTGTPPRLDGRSISWEKCAPQPGDAKPTPFSFMNDELEFKSVQCYITKTNQTTHDFIRDNQSRHSALGINAARFENVESPRYCMSIHDKVGRFPEKSYHQIFLEPEDIEYNTIYPNGISTSFSLEKQQEMINTIEGLENAKIVFPGYLIDYEFVFPSELYHTLETKKIAGLFLAGQINGTTGYEEAASQGIIAGVNAVLSLSNKSFILGRDQAYIGVLIDDLVSTTNLTEPYRLFTTRAEYRLALRPDNADFRLTEAACAIGLVSEKRMRRFLRRKHQTEELTALLKNTTVKPEQLARLSIAAQQNSPVRNCYQLLSCQGCAPEFLLAIAPEAQRYSADILEQVCVNGKYAPYLKRQEREVAIFSKEANLAIPEDLDYHSVLGLSYAAQEKLSAVRPINIAAAGAVYGVKPIDVLVLIAYLKKYRNSVPRETIISTN